MERQNANYDPRNSNNSTGNRQEVQREHRTFCQESWLISKGWGLATGWGQCSFSALTLLAGWQEGHLACKKPMSLIHKGSLLEEVEKETTTSTTTILRPFVRDYSGKPVPEETCTHPPSWSSSNLYQRLPFTTIHSILPVQFTCLAIFLHNLPPSRLWSTLWSGAFHLILHTFLHQLSVFFSQHVLSLFFTLSLPVIKPFN